MHGAFKYGFCDSIVFAFLNSEGLVNFGKPFSATEDRFSY